MIYNSTKLKKDHKQKGLMFVDINITGQMSVPVYMGTYNLFISKKVVGKLGLSISKSTKKIKTMNSKSVSIVGAAQLVELQINEWKGKKDFEVIHLDDYDSCLV
ncbi:hypothetical protein J1N35_028783 [Gossypium stocksii]|uniref:Uncharacterized protein n=1 Tax=Gossypium stocksii TaxID=47602 RepID=A0A9D3UWK6_9ROSI|nr:hypothetical protein J1N35_028783 [Gossypium stocksii]